MRLREKSKLAHEKAVADNLFKELKIRQLGSRPGNPDRKEPDRLYRINKKTIGIEVVTAYYSKREAKRAAEVAEKPLAVNEIALGEIMGSPDDAICEAIQKNLDEKCCKTYSGTDETWLCINVEVGITEMAVIQDCVAILEVPENQFARIFV